MNLGALVKLMALQILNQSEFDSVSYDSVSTKYLPDYDGPTIIVEKNGLENKKIEVPNEYMPPFDCSMPIPPTHELPSEMSFSEHDLNVMPPFQDQEEHGRGTKVNAEEKAMKVDGEKSQATVSDKFVVSETQNQGQTTIVAENSKYGENILKLRGKPQAQANKGLMKNKGVVVHLNEPSTLEERSEDEVNLHVERPHAKASIGTEATKSRSNVSKGELNKNADELRAKASMKIVHRLSESEVLNLHRLEQRCEEKIHDVYMAIKELNNFNYEKNQEIMYLSYDIERKREISEQSNEKKKEIIRLYEDMHNICNKAEIERDRMTTQLNPTAERSEKFYAQPSRIPECWYSMHNLEVIILQLFTPKLKTKTYLDEGANVLRMQPKSKVVMQPKRFIPLPDDYNVPSSTISDVDEATVDRSSLIVQNNKIKTPFASANNEKPDGSHKYNVFAQRTYSRSEDIQQIIIHYLFKYWEHEVQDFTRRVFHYSRSLKYLKRSCTDKAKISESENKLAEALAELQTATMEMERNRVTPEIINLYNAENAALDLLPNTKFVSKLIGNKHHRRVITSFNPSEAIQWNALTQSQSDNDLVIKTNEVEFREDLPAPLEWDRNPSWDY